MGAYWSTPRSINKETYNIISYLCSVRDKPLSIDPTVSLSIKRSNIPSTFIDGKQYGVFTDKNIARGTIISSTNIYMYNDGLIDLTELLNADNSEKTYIAWKNLKQSYYNIDKIKSVVNVIMVKDSYDTDYYEAITDIPANSELIRMYGFTTWIFELFDILTNKTIVGFSHFVNNLCSNIKGDPLELKVLKLRNILNGQRYMMTQCKEYDRLMKSEPTVYVGDEIKALYIAEK